MERIWLKSYPPGMATDIDPAELPSLKVMAERSFATFRARTAFIQMGRHLTYGELDRLSRDFAAWLQHSGLKRGDRLGIMLPNVLQYPIAMFAALRAGFTVVNINPLYTAPELEHQLRDSGCVALVVLENFAHVVEAVLPRTSLKHVVVTSVGELLGFPKSAIVDFVVRRVHHQVPPFDIPGAMRFSAALAAGRGHALADIDLTHDDIAFLQYTGGTTGVAKGAMLTHGNICSNVLQASGWVAPFLPPAIERAQYLVTPIPLYHIFALTANCMLFLRLGWSNVLIVNPRDFPAFVAELKRYPFAFLSGVNTLFNALLHTSGFDRVDFSHLKITLGGGMAVQEPVARRWKAVTGIPLTQAWGLTETSPGACINLPQTEFNGSIGLPIASTEISIRDEAGAELPLGTVGEICVKGPQVMRGYWNRPDETALVMLPGGWLRTGDIGRMDEKGFVYIEDRKKDMIVVSGFKVFPNQVEEVVAAIPGIVEVAAVAQTDERAGEIVALFVVSRDPALTERAIIDKCRESLTGYKLPRHVYFRKELPKSNVGKILRRTLRDELAQRFATPQ
ncbi:MAG TPA: AMP-binding protein [Steroidobacteraceae bacterium]|nr:AMP-binding protein [Steroidobacteraceae bacterium]